MGCPATTIIAPQRQLRLECSTLTTGGNHSLPTQPIRAFPAVVLAKNDCRGNVPQLSLGVSVLIVVLHARQRLCLRATTDYWVNQPGGIPVFKINQTVDPGMIEVLRTQIIPASKKTSPINPAPNNSKPTPTSLASPSSSTAKATAPPSSKNSGKTPSRSWPTAPKPP